MQKMVLPTIKAIEQEVSLIIKNIFYGVNNTWSMDFNVRI